MSLERIVDYGGKSLTVTQWASRTGLPFKIIIARLNSGWPVEKALTRNVRGWGNPAESKSEYERDDDRGHRKVFMDTEHGDQGAML